MGKRGDQDCQSNGRINWQPTFRILDDRNQPSRVGRPLWHDLPELGQMAPQGIDRLRALPDQKFRNGPIVTACLSLG